MLSALQGFLHLESQTKPKNVGQENDCLDKDNWVCCSLLQKQTSNFRIQFVTIDSIHPEIPSPGNAVHI